MYAVLYFFCPSANSAANTVDAAANVGAANAAAGNAEL